MQKTDQQKSRKILLGISVITNLGLLGVFKYYDFFVSSFIDAFSYFNVDLNVTTLNIILPVGISFYTFQTLSYTIDVYRKKLDATNNFIAFSAFVSFFPQLVAGPIERATHLLPQFFVKRVFDFNKAVAGLQLMLWGFFKKIVIADNVGRIVDIVYNDPGNFHGWSIVIATILFAIQIYCDFSGYSDIAIGCAKLFGFDLMKNFDAPYFSTSPKEFWRRWHISLSTWFRDYVYVPLGGNRSGFRRMQINLMLTFLLSGLWHGANWTFVIWGLLHGAAICIQNYLEQKKINFKLNKIISGIFLFLFVCFGWIFFRSDSVNDAILLITNLFTQVDANELLKLFPTTNLLRVISFSLLVFILLEILIRNSKVVDTFNKKHSLVRWACYYGIIIWILFFGALDEAPHFIYFQF